MRFFPATVKVRSLIAGGSIGDVMHLNASFGFRLEKMHDRLVKPELGGGAILDIGVYVINLALMVFGEKPTSVQSSGTLWETGVDETVAMTLRL